MLTLVRMRFRASIRAALDMASNLREERYLHGVKRRKITTRHCPHCHQTLAYKTFKAHKRRYFNRDTSEWYCEHAELSDTGDTDTGDTGTSTNYESPPASPSICDPPTHYMPELETVESPPHDESSTVEMSEPEGISGTLK